jgi:hypothetical protein
MDGSGIISSGGRFLWSLVEADEVRIGCISGDALGIASEAAESVRDRLSVSVL